MAIKSLKSGSYGRSVMAGNSLILPGDFESIATFNGTGSSGSITFNSIPQTFTHLQLRIYGSVTVSSQVLFLTTNNGTSTSYAYHSLAGDGATASAPSISISNSFIRVFGTTTASSSSYPFSSIVDILDYTNINKYKTFRTLCGGDYNGSGDVALYSGLNMITNAINQITVYMSSGNFNTSTKVALYGIRG